MIKMPQARAKAAEASLPTLVEDGNVFLRMRRTHASGGSNSTAEGGCGCDLSLSGGDVGVGSLMVLGGCCCCGGCWLQDGQCSGNNIIISSL